MKKKNAVVMCVSKNIIFSAGVLILNLENVIPGIVDEYVIIHDGISKKNEKALKLIGKVRFIEYDKPEFFFEGIDPQLIHQFTRVVFSKFECLKLLNDYENILLTDTDVLVFDDISELFDGCKSGIKIMIGDELVQSQFINPVPGYKMEINGMCAGLMVFHDNLIGYESIYDWCYLTLMKHAKNIKMPEQAVFDLMIQDHKLQPSKIDPVVYCRLPSQGHLLDKAKILHTSGQPKFWTGYKSDEWEFYYKKWVSIGGERFNIKKMLINKCCPPGGFARKAFQRIYHFYIRNLKI